MGKLTERLKDATRSGVYRVTRADEVVDAVQGTGNSLARIRYADKPALMKNIAAALRLPDWFGANWDALEDSLSDLPDRGYVLLFENARAGDELGVLIDVLRSSAEWWAGRGKPFFVVFIDPARALPLPDLFREK
ncbi:MAG TPA: barstar family protein [Burkholderiales bacterium]|nr:barstar family protein [Burkholderiales bacterium]